MSTTAQTDGTHPARLISAPRPGRGQTDTDRGAPPSGTAPAPGPPDVHSREHRVCRAPRTLLPISCASSPCPSAIARCDLVRHPARRSREMDIFSFIPQDTNDLLGGCERFSSVHMIGLWERSFGLTCPPRPSLAYPPGCGTARFAQSSAASHFRRAKQTMRRCVV